MKQSYIIVSDIHGSVSATEALLSLLEQRGWSWQWTRKGEPVLHHDEEMLIVAGDSNDRGDWSVPFSYLVASSWVNAQDLGLSFSVQPLMGNHDIRIKRWAKKGYSNSQGFQLTLQQLCDPKYKMQSNLLAEAVPEYPYWYEEQDFVVAHAYWREPFPTEEEAIYGPTIKGTGTSPGMDFRIRWWHRESREKPLIFGHYHAQMDIVFPERNLYCVDNHDAGVFSYVVVADGVASFRLHEGVRSKMLDNMKRLAK